MLNERALFRELAKFCQEEKLHTVGEEITEFLLKIKMEKVHTL
jgi:hypothetical protein